MKMSQLLSYGALLQGTIFIIHSPFMSENSVKVRSPFPTTDSPELNIFSLKRCKTGKEQQILKLEKLEPEIF